MTKRIIILGCRGFIGSMLFKKFSADEQYEVSGFSSQECDLLSSVSTRRALSDLKKEDVVIMASAITRLKENTFEAMMKNIQMVENITHVIVERPIKQFIYLSTIDVFGSLEKNSNSQNVKINEDCELAPDEYYGLSKMTCEFLLKKHLAGRGIHLAILRFPGVYGPGDCGKSLIGRFIHSAIKEGKIFIKGDGSDLRDYLYVDCVCAAVKEAIRAGLNKSVNIVSDKSYSIKQIAQMIQSALGKNCTIEYREEKHSDHSRRKHMQFDNARLQKILPGVKFSDLSRGISLYLEYLRHPQIAQTQQIIEFRKINGTLLKSSKCSINLQKFNNVDLRKRIVDLIYKAKAGHIPSAFSIVDILAYLYAKVLKFDSHNPKWSERDFFLLSKGHGCAAFYVLLEQYGFIAQEDLDKMCYYDGILGGHPDATKVPGAEGSTGSLGHGICTALGVALGLRIKQMNNKVIVLIGDGESNEGTVWESALVAANLKLGNLCCIIDNNGSAAQILPVAPLKEKWEAFGWEAQVMDGHDPDDIARTFGRINFEHNTKPKVIIANTVKGKGVSFMEVHGPWHYRTPNEEELKQIYEELEACRH